MADLEDRKVALIAQLDSHRRQLSLGGHRIQGRFNAMRRFKENFAAYPWIWIGAAAVIGLVLTRRRAPKFRVERRTVETRELPTKASVALGTLKFLFDLSRPALVSQLGLRVAEMISRRTGSRRER
jgi:hypothetical protein